MVSINWCKKQKDGLRLIEPNLNIASSYIELAKKSLGTMNRERNYNLVFSISACYYSMYYSLYAIMMKLGIKCEIRACSLEFMKTNLSKFFPEEKTKIIKKAFKLRNLAQYYVDKILDEKDINEVTEKAEEFVLFSEQILSKINEDDIKEIRSKLN